MILGVGVDIVAVSRVERAMRGPRFLARIYTQQERDYIAAHGAQSAAALFAAKEAAAKALGTGFCGMRFEDIEVAHLKNGRPVYALHGGARERFQAIGATALHLSISHEGDMAVAFAVLEGGTKEEAR